MCVSKRERDFACMCVCSPSMLAFLFNNLLCQSLRCRRLREHSRSLVLRQCTFTHTHTHIQFLNVCVLLSRWKCLLSAGVLADLCLRESGRISERKKENEEERKPSGKPFQSDSSSFVCVCVYASVCVIFPASSSCLPSLL